MKVRSDFVTNSSSSSFIMAFKDDDRWASYDYFAERCNELFYDSFYNLIESLQKRPENVSKEKALEVLYWYYSYEYRIELIDSLLKIEDYASYQEYFKAKLELEESEEFKEKVKNHVNQNEEYLDKIELIKESNEHDILEMSGSRAVWPDVLSVYAVKVTTDEENPQEVATLTEEKEAILREIFWEMNEISHTVTTEEETVIVERDDGMGNIIEEETIETKTTLRIVVGHKNATCFASMTTLKDAVTATSVFPKPTSPQRSLSIGFGFSKSSLISLMAVF